MIKYVLDKDKNVNIEKLVELHLKLINDNKIEMPIIRIMSHDFYQQVTFRLPLELQAFIAGLEFSDHMDYFDKKK